METKYKVGDEISIYDPIEDDYISKKIEAVCFTNDTVYYMTDPVDLCLLGIDEKELPDKKYQFDTKKIKKRIKEISKDKMYGILDGKIITIN